MEMNMKRRQFLQAAAGAALYLSGGPGVAASQARTTLVSPGARRSRVRVAKLYLGKPKAHWPTPDMDIHAERQRYETEFAARAKDFADTDFTVNELVTTAEQAKEIAARLDEVDGVLLIHLSMGIWDMLPALLAAGKPTMVFAAPYSGHEWSGFGALRQRPEGALLECLLTSDFDQLAIAVHPFRAIHHLREAKILNATLNELPADFVQAVKTKFGAEIVRIDHARVMAAYDAIDPAAAEAETESWMKRAEEIVEPSRDEIHRSCRLALAFEKLLDEENATVMTVDCYGSMYGRLPAFPCVGFARLNDLGYGGICESDLRSALTFILLQALSGRPGFISDPTVDESTGSIILAHCMGSTKMDGPENPPCPYRLRSIMERQEGAAPQVRMPVGRKVTQAELMTMDKLLYFTGEAIDSPDTERGCRTKITVNVDGDIEALWQNWSGGLHRVTCYGDLRHDLKRFCRFKSVQMVDEAQPGAVRS